MVLNQLWLTLKQTTLLKWTTSSRRSLLPMISMSMYPRKRASTMTAMMRSLTLMRRMVAISSVLMTLATL
ncbi:hypothetical protein MT325_m736L [Paramecium bursaria chlorella virus MT325]|uniref:Uncharacterized protein m736L n=1 Tax=Paramecium bursaria Chlorella virus MT325 TaxID=346932 RepID=A7IVB6_PBCVM|nr:hypothetical protein MT325_m736L [Paramecium bursaria chlorella virus MT325]